MSEFENIRYMPIVTAEQVVKFRGEALRLAKDLDSAREEINKIKSTRIYKVVSWIAKQI